MVAAHIIAEFERIWGPDAQDAEKGFVLLPLASEKEALVFLRTVPTGTPIAELPRLCEGFRLEKQFYARTRDRSLPYVHNDEVEVLIGPNAGRRGIVDELAYAESPIQFLVDFRDGTDELFAAPMLKLISSAT